MNKNFKNIALIFLLTLLGFTIITMMQKKPEEKAIPYSEFLKIVKEPAYKDIDLKIIGKEIIGTYIDTKRGDRGEALIFKTFIPYNDPQLIPILEKRGIAFKGEKPEDNMILKSLIGIIPWILVIGIVWFFMIRQLQNTGNRALSFGKSRAKLAGESKRKITFLDIAGVEEAKEELQEVIEFLKEPKKFQSIGAKIPRGVLLVGPPGTGKTLLARAVAGEAGVPFFSISGSDFVEMFVGVGASRVRDLFDQGKTKAPCIIFIDEIDAVGRLRGAGLGGGHDEREQTLNQILVEMDGFETNDGVIIIAATNRPDVLDPALLRPGRFDRQVVVDIPDIRGREAILNVHIKEIPLSQDVVLKVIARGTPGFTGADLANLVNEAALLAARKNKKRVNMEEFEEAKDKVLMGPQRLSMIISDAEKEIIAFHEAGHAVLGFLMPHAEPVHKVTIIPRGRALGLTQHLPEVDRMLHNRSYYLTLITVLYGGKIAEEIKFGETTTGAANDLERASTIARKMVTEWGMSEKLGSIRFIEGNDQIFIGREIARHKNYSEATAIAIDTEIKIVLDSCYKNAQNLIKKNKKKWEAIAQGLLERETLDGNDLKLLVKGKTLPPIKGGDSQKPDSDKKISENKKDKEIGVLKPQPTVS
jgi:cell division protease FtsH